MKKIILSIVLLLFIGVFSSHGQQAIKIYRNNNLVFIDNGSPVVFMERSRAVRLYQNTATNFTVEIQIKGGVKRFDFEISDLQDKDGIPVGTLQQVKDYLSLIINFDTPRGGADGATLNSDTQITSNFVDTDVTLNANSDVLIASQRATKGYADSVSNTAVQITGSTMTGNLDIGTTTVQNFRSLGIDDNADAIAITINSSENVGIGTTNSSSKLTVVVPDGETMVISTTSAGTGGISGLEFNWDSATGDGTRNVARIMALTQSGGGGDLFFQTAPSISDDYITKMTIERAGNVVLTENLLMASAKTVDGVDVSARDIILTTTTTTADAALPKTGGTMTGNLDIGTTTVQNFKSLGIDDNALSTALTIDVDGDVTLSGKLALVSLTKSTTLTTALVNSVTLEGVIIGGDVVVNGSFDDLSAWVLSGPSTVITGNGVRIAGNGVLTQSNILVVDKFYKIDYEVVEFPNSELLTDASGSVTYDVSTLGLKTQFFRATSVDLAFVGSESLFVVLNNIVVQEVSSISEVQTRELSEDAFLDNVPAFTGSYDAAANNPDLDVTPIGITIGSMYEVTVAGDFFTRLIRVGDLLMANQDDPTQLSHWVITNRQLVGIEDNATAVGMTIDVNGNVSLSSRLSLESLELNTTETTVLVNTLGAGGAVIGGDVVVNGGFDDTSVWSVEGHILNSIATLAASIFRISGVDGILRQSNILVVDKFYKIDYEVIDATTSTLSDEAGIVIYDGSTSGLKTQFFKANSVDLVFALTTTDSSIRIDNIVVQEVAGIPEVQTRELGEAAFITLLGIDDNADATAITIDIDENVDITGDVTASKFIGDGTMLTGVSGFKGSYDAATNTPNLDAAPTGIKQGSMYKVTVAGNFFTRIIRIGDLLMAIQDDPTAISHWVITNKNLIGIEDNSIQVNTTPIPFSIGSNNVVTVTSNASVGSLGGFPAGHFRIRSANTSENGNAVITGHNTNNGDRQIWYFGSTSSGNDNIALINRRPGTLTFQTSTGIALVMENNKDITIPTKLGIGPFDDDTPAVELLHISNQTLNTGNPTIRIDGRASIDFTGTNGFIGSIDFHNSNTADLGVSASIVAGRGQGVAGSGELRFRTSATIDNPLDRMTITKDGNVVLTENIVMAANKTVDGIDISARDGVLAATTTAALAALPKAGGTMTGDLDIGANNVTASQYRLSSLNTAPASATAPGTLGEIRVTSTHIYVCIATDIWVRVAIDTWS